MLNSAFGGVHAAADVLPDGGSVAMKGHCDRLPRIDEHICGKEAYTHFWPPDVRGVSQSSSFVL